MTGVARPVDATLESSDLIFLDAKLMGGYQVEIAPRHRVKVGFADVDKADLNGIFRHMVNLIGGELAQDQPLGF